MSARPPAAEDMLLAAEWLDVYEDAEDFEACKRVAQWLRQQADASDFRAACRAAGVPVQVARKRIAKNRITRTHRTTD